jgi:hypothetical protein
MKNDAKEAARALSALGASKGGLARAKALTPEERSEIARAAVQERWAREGKEPLPRATHAGPLKISDIEFDCAVLEDKARVVSEQKFMAALGMYRSGALSVRRKTSDTGAQIPLFLAHKNLKPYAIKHLGDVHFEPLKYRTLEGNVAHGIKAEIIPKICEIWIDANRDGVLGHRQKLTAGKADILLRGFAHVGIIALVDEATGFQDDRARDALAQILEAFVAKELKEWVRTFPADFYKELFRLRKIPYKETVKRPQYIGHLTNDLIYARLAPGVLKELKRITPRDDRGRLKHKLFQRLTEDFGHPKLRDHLVSVITLMKASDGWQQFKPLVDKALPRFVSLPLFDKEDKMDFEEERA